MPGWHDATAELQQKGDLQMVGIVLEQHPDRTRLFMQWKQMGWPILVDSLNLMGLAVVPVTLLIDEHGIVRFRGELDKLEEFLRAEPKGPARPAPTIERPVLGELAAATVTSSSLRQHADALFLWGGPTRIDETIETYRRALTTEPKHGPTHFRLGVAYRQRYDSDKRQAGDFQRAVEHWSAALDLDPNQYIWRRRIQQYGPRLTKPYPFYDWVDQARADISARGDTPVSLPIEPRGAEIARPARAFSSSDDEREAPDPQGKIRRDEKGFIHAEATLVPSALEPGTAGRVHWVFRPNVTIKAHWNNEAEDLAVWIEAPAGWQIDQQLLTTPNPPQLVSNEARRLELEVKSPEGFAGGTATLSGYALYYVCEDVRGTCLYRRQDITLDLPVASQH